MLSPFAGIGSEGYVAVQLGRRFLGVELKPEYHEAATRNLEHAERIVLAQARCSRVTIKQFAVRVRRWSNDVF